MTIDPEDLDPIEKYIHDYMLFRDGIAERPSLDDLHGDDRREAAARVRILEATDPSTAVVAPGAANRLASAFGFDRVGTPIAISGRKLKAARRRAGLELKDVAAAVAAAGAAVRTAELLHVETADTATLDQAIVTRLVAVLGVTVAEIEGEFDEQVNEMRALLASPRFERVIAGWAVDHRRDVSEVRDRVHEQVLAAKYRAEAINEDQLLDIVRAILGRLEP